MNFNNNLSFFISFFESMFIILCSELGDKTFLNVALMSMKYNIYLIFISASSALVISTILSSIIGAFLPYFLSPFYKSILVIVLYSYFGISILIESFTSKDKNKKNEENSLDNLGSMETDDELSIDDYSLEQNKKKLKLTENKNFSSENINLFIKNFLLIFLAEWGDKSQITTIAIAASKHWIGVVIGASIGHIVCTFIAVIGGNFLSMYISEKVVQIIGGSLFLFYAITQMITLI